MVLTHRHMKGRDAGLLNEQDRALLEAEIN